MGEILTRWWFCRVGEAKRAHQFEAGMVGTSLSSFALPTFYVILSNYRSPRIAVSLA